MLRYKKNDRYGVYNAIILRAYELLLLGLDTRIVLLLRSPPPPATTMQYTFDAWNNIYNGQTQIPIEVKKYIVTLLL